MLPGRECFDRSLVLMILCRFEPLVAVSIDRPHRRDFVATEHEMKDAGDCKMRDVLIWMRQLSCITLHR